MTTRQEKKPTKHQHYVPQRYLANFCNGDALWAYDKAARRSFRTGPSRVAAENGFYTLPSDPPTEEPLIERLLADVEVETNRTTTAILGRVANYQSLFPGLDAAATLDAQSIITKKDRFVLAWNIVLQASRTPAARLGRQQMATQMYEFAQELFAGREELDFSGVDPSNAPDPASEQARAMFSGHGIEAAKRLCSGTFVFWWNRTEQPFFTSDHPVATQDNSVLESTGMGALARVSSRGAIMFPLSSSVVLLVMHHDGEAVVPNLDGKVIGIDDPTEPNAYQVMGSLRQVYCAEDKFELVERGLAAHPELGDPKRQVVQLRTLEQHLSAVRERTRMHPPTVVKVGDPVLVMAPDQVDGPEGGHVLIVRALSFVVQLLDGSSVEVPKGYVVPTTEAMLDLAR